MELVSSLRHPHLCNHTETGGEISLNSVWNDKRSESGCFCSSVFLLLLDLQPGVALGRVLDWPQGVIRRLKDWHFRAEGNGGDGQTDGNDILHLLGVGGESKETVQEGDTPQVEGGSDDNKTSPECLSIHLDSTSPGCNQSHLFLGEEWLHGDNNSLLNPHLCSCAVQPWQR